MNITFEVSAFKNNPKALISILSNLKNQNQWSLRHDREVEEIVCYTPSSAYSFCRFVVGTFGVSKEAERVFLKNPKIGIRYLYLVRRDHFLDEDTQRRFRKKLSRDPALALDWAKNFKKRLTEDEEMVFAEDPRCALEYCSRVVLGTLPDKVHERIVLKSFEPKTEWEKRYLKDYMDYVARQKASKMAAKVRNG